MQLEIRGDQVVENDVVMELQEFLFLVWRHWAAPICLHVSLGEFVVRERGSS